MATVNPSLEGWRITHGADADWTPWGEDGKARAKLLGTADGYVVALVEADAGYRGTPHEHAHAEFSFVVNGTIRSQGNIRRLVTATPRQRGPRTTTSLAPSTYLTISVSELASPKGSTNAHCRI